MIIHGIIFSEPGFWILEYQLVTHELTITAAPALAPDLTKVSTTSA